MTLERELATYQAHLPTLKADEGKWVLIHGEDVIDTFSSYEDALKRGYQDFKLDPFLVKRINAYEEAQMITRLIAPTATLLC